jgi:hypothetical protein
MSLVADLITCARKIDGRTKKREVSAKEGGRASIENTKSGVLSNLKSSMHVTRKNRRNGSWEPPDLRDVKDGTCDTS